MIRTNQEPTVLSKKDRPIEQRLQPLLFKELQLESLHTCLQRESFARKLLIRGILPPILSSIQNRLLASAGLQLWKRMTKEEICTHNHKLSKILILRRRCIEWICHPMIKRCNSWRQSKIKKKLHTKFKTNSNFYVIKPRMTKNMKRSSNNIKKRKNLFSLLMTSKLD